MTILRKFIFITGILTLIHFVITGQLMRHGFFTIDREDLLLRMMFRSNHIYILFCGLLNLVLYYAIRNQEKWHWLLTLALVVMATASIILNLSFYTDPASHSLQRSMTRMGVYGCLAGTILSLVVIQFLSYRNKDTEQYP